MMNKYNPIVYALRSQLGSHLYTGNVSPGGEIPCGFKSKEMEIEIQKQLEGLKYE